MTTQNVILIREAHKAIKAGQKQQARSLLHRALRQNPNDFAVWLLLASVASSPRTSLEYIRQAEKLNPGHPTIRKARAWAERRLLTAAPPAAPQPAPPPPTRRAAPSKIGTNWQTIVILGSITMTLAILVFIAMMWVVSNFVLGAPQGAAVEPVKAQDNSQSSLLQENVRVSAQSSGKLPTGIDNEVAVVEATATPMPDPTSSPTPPRLPAKQVAPAGNADRSSDPRPTWTVTPVPTNTPTPTPTPLPTFVSPQNNKPVSRPLGVGANEHWVDVDLSTQTLTAYEGDTPVMTSLISSGTYNHPTVTGQFRVWLRFERQTMNGRRLGYDYYLENVPYVMYFYQDYALHGTYWHNNFGTPMSHGCVNMQTEDAGWLFNWSSLGMLVNVHY
ncbi:MAG: L,D-transpeptidase family protein [Anaerolineae bacterium]